MQERTHKGFSDIGRISFGNASLVLTLEKKTFKKTLWPLFMVALRATEPLRAGSLVFTTKFPGIPNTHLIDLGRMKD